MNQRKARRNKWKSKNESTTSQISCIFEVDLDGIKAIRLWSDHGWGRTVLLPPESRDNKKTIALMSIGTRMKNWKGEYKDFLKGGQQSHVQLAGLWIFPCVRVRWKGNKIHCYFLWQSLAFCRDHPILLRRAPQVTYVCRDDMAQWSQLYYIFMIWNVAFQYQTQENFAHIGISQMENSVLCHSIFCETKFRQRIPFFPNWKLF